MRVATRKRKKPVNQAWIRRRWRRYVNKGLDANAALMQVLSDAFDREGITPEDALRALKQDDGKGNRK